MADEEKKRPFARKRSEATSTGDVYVRKEEGLGRSVGNTVGETRDRVPYGGKSPGRGRGSTGGFLKYLIVLLIALIGGSSGLSSLFSGSPSPVDSGEGEAQIFFHKPTTSYVEVNSETLNTETLEGSRKKFTEIIGNGEDTVTVLVYITATDLESDYGMATADINEMVYALPSDKVNVVFQAGGNRTWKNSAMQAGRIQRWRVARQDEGRGIIALDKNVGSASMTDPDTLLDFIRYGCTEFPANRVILILWDHGGGSVSGYGYDEYYPNSTMTLDEIAYALKESEQKFDIVGFDACLMATAETATALAPYADYLLASEETEPGTGWYYTDWLTALARNSSMPSIEIGKNIIDSYLEKGNARDELSLSLVDLADFVNAVPAKLSAFSKNISTAIEKNNYQTLADARSVTKEFASGTQIDQIDLIHFAKNVNDSSSEELVNALQTAIKYNRTKNIRNAYGLSIFFPYSAPAYVNNAVSIYEDIGMDAEYTRAIRNFVTLEASGQILTQNASNSVYDYLSGQAAPSSALSTEDIQHLLQGQGGHYSVTDLLNNHVINDQLLDLVSGFLHSRSLAGKKIGISNVDGHRVVRLEKKDWETIQDITLNVWIKDEDGYIDLGYDNVFDFDKKGNLLAEYDGRWISLNNHIVSYFYESQEVVDEENYRIRGYVPALWNGELVHILIEFRNENPEGIVLGARKVYDGGVEAKGYVRMKEGDSLDFLADYYDRSGNFKDAYPLGETYIIKDAFPEDEERLLKVGTLKIVGEEALFGYRFLDMFQAAHYTEMTEWK